MAAAPPATLPDVRRGGRRALRRTAETFGRLGAAESECLPLQLAVEEICTNLMEYGYGERRPHAIGIARLGGDPLGKDRLGDPVPCDLVVTSATDHRRSPHVAPPSDLGAGVEEHRIGGRGWHLVKELAHRMAQIAQEETVER